MTRTLHVSHTSSISGAEHSLLELVGALDRDGCLGIACPDGDLADAARGLGVAVHRVPGTSGSLRQHPVHTPRAAAELLAMAGSLARVARRVRADVLHANSVRAGLATGAGRRLGTPPAVVHVRDVLPEGRATALVRGFTLRTAGRLVANSAYTAGRFVPAPARRPVPLDVVDNPVSLERFDPVAADGARVRREFGLDPAAPVLALVGQITRWKGHETAIRALAGLLPSRPGARLVVAGAIKFAESGTRFDNRAFLDEMRALAAELGVADAVLWIGERDDVPDVMAAADVVLVPSSEEPFGRTVVEAMAVGTPVVATSAGGPPEILEDGALGALAPPGDPASWTRAVDRVLRDPGTAAATAAAARERARERFGAQRHAQRMAAVFAALHAGRD